MVVEKGYKQSEIGVIPEDWEVKELSEILKFGSGKDYKHLSFGDYPVYGTGGVMTHVDSFLYEGESVGIGRKGTIDKPVFLNGRFWTVDTLFYTHTFTNVIPKFVYYKFLQIKWREYNEASGVPSLNKNTLDKIKIALPLLPEQTAIANALSDMDALIAQTEKLIEKKKAIKQGVMQELLKPKVGWVTKKLGDYIKFQTGFPFSSLCFTDNPAGIRLIKNRDLRSDDSIVFYNGVYSNDFLVQNGDLLIGMDGDFEPVLWGKGMALLNQRVGRIIKCKDISIEFLSYILLKELKKIESQTGSTTVKHLSHTDIEDIELLLPTINEQIKTGAILQEIDIELTKLVNKLQKLKHQKLGMMQALLTGKIRLI